MTILDFTVIGRDLASGSFAAIGAAIESVNVKLDQLKAKNVNVRIVIDDAEATSKLAATAAKVDQLTAKNVNIRVVVDDVLGAEKLAATSAKVDQLTAKNANIRVNVDDALSTEKLVSTSTKVDQLTAKNANIRVNVDDVVASEKLMATTVKVDQLTAKNANIRVNVDDVLAAEKLVSTSVKVDQLTAKNANIRVNVDDVVASEKLMATTVKVDQLTAKNANIRVNVDDVVASEKLVSTAAKVDGLTSKNANIRVNVDDMLATDKLVSTAAKVDALTAKNVNIRVNVDDAGAAAKLGATSAAVTDLDSKAARAGGPSGGTKILGQGFIALGAVALAAGGESVNLALQFEHSTDKMAAQAGITSAAGRAIGDAFLTTAGTTRYSAIQIEEAFGPVAAKIGEVQGHSLSASEALTFMTAAMNANAATGGDLDATTGALANVMAAYGMKVQDAAHASDILTNASHLTGVPIADLTTGIDRLHLRLGPLAPSLQDVGTLVADLGQHGVTGTRGLMQVSTALMSLIKPSADGSAELKTLGVNVFDASGKFVGMESVIAQLNPKLAGMTEQQRLLALEQIFGKSAAGTMNQIIMDGAGVYHNLALKVGEAGSAQRDATTIGESLTVKFNKLKAELVDTGIRIGTALIPALSGMLSIISPIINAVSAWGVANPKLAGTLLLLTVGVGAFSGVLLVGTKVIAALAPLVTVLTAVVKGLGVAFTFLSANPIVILIAAVVLLVAAFVILELKFHFIEAAARALGSFFSGAFLDAFKAVGAWFVGPFVGFFQKVGDFLKTWGPLMLAVMVPFLGIPLLITQHWSVVSGFFQQLWSQISTIFQTGIAATTAVFNSMYAIIAPIAQRIWHDVAGFFTNLWHDTVNAFTFLWHDSAAMVTNLWADTTRIATSVWHDVAALFTNLWHDGVNAFTFLWHDSAAVATNLWHDVVSFFTNLWHDSVNVFTNLWHDVVNVFTNLWHDDVNVITNLWHDVVGLFTNLWNDVKNISTNLWNDVRTIFTSLWTDARNIFTSMWTDLRNISTSLWTDVKNIFTNMWTDVRNISTSLWNDARNIFTSMWNDLRNISTSLWNDVRTIFTSMWTDVRNICTGLWNDARNIFTSMWTDLRNITTSLWNDVRNLFTNLWHDVDTIATNLWHDVSTFFNNMGIEVVQHITDLYNVATSIFSNLWKFLGSVATSIWHEITNTFNMMKDGLIATFRDIANFAFVNPINFVINAVVNGGIDGILSVIDGVIGTNWHAHVNPIPGFAMGGVVPGYAPGLDVVPAMLSPGEGVLVPEAVKMLGGAPAVHAMNSMSTARVAGPGDNGVVNKHGTQYASLGGVIGDIWGGITGVASSIWGGIKTAFNWVKGNVAAGAKFVLDHSVYPLVDNMAKPGDWGQLPKLATHKIGDGLINMLLARDAADNAAMAASGGGPIAYNASAGVKQWDPQILQSLSMLGQAANWLGTVERRMAQESGGNPNAVNLTDSNAQAGHPSVGLMQVIAGTYAAYKGPDAPPYMYGVSVDPLSNIFAGLHYALARYGSLGALNQPGGYANGALFTKPTMGILGEAGPEILLPLNKPRRITELLAQAGIGGGGGVVVSIPITVNGNMSSGTVSTIERQLVPKLRMALQQQIGRRNRV